MIDLIHWSLLVFVAWRADLDVNNFSIKVSIVTVLNFIILMLFHNLTRSSIDVLGELPDILRVEMRCLILIFSKLERDFILIFFKHFANVLYRFATFQQRLRSQFL